MAKNLPQVISDLKNGKGVFVGSPLFVRDDGSGVALAAGKLYTDGTDIYVFGSGSLAKI